MSSVEYLREFVSERLTAAAEEIFGVFKRTIAEYEDEIDRQRRLLVRYHVADLQQQPVCQKEEVPNEQQLCDSSLDQEDPEPPQIKQEQEDLCSSQEREQLVVKQETETVVLPPVAEERDKREDQTLEFCPGEEEIVVNVRGESQTEDGGDREDSSDAEAKKINHTQKSKWRNSTLTPHRSTVTGATFKCDTCGKDFKHNSKFKAHLRSHTGEKPYVCKTCRTAFTSSSTLSRHVRTVHAGEKYLCKVCGSTFKHSNSLTVHVRGHAGEKPYVCKLCGEGFARKCHLKTHGSTHTLEKQHVCKMCGRSFGCNSNLTVHMRTHTGERPYSCSGCGKRFSQLAILNNHLRTHTGEKPYSCSICGASFSQSSSLNRHFRIHR